MEDCSDSKCLKSLIPYLLSSSSSSFLSHNNINSNNDKTHALRKILHSSFLSSNLQSADRLLPPPPIQLFSPIYFATCTAGGILSCGLTHMAVTPLDLVKCNMQIDPTKYTSIPSGFGVLLKEHGLCGFFKGWLPTLFGYSAQGAFKFGFYEFFKKWYSDIAGPEYATKYNTFIYLAGSASAEVIADIALCPFEAVKVRVQTQPGFARGLVDGFPKFVKSEGTLGYGDR